MTHRIRVNEGEFLGKERLKMNHMLKYLHDASVGLAPPAKSIDNADTPYQAAAGDCLLVAMSSGDVNVLVPVNGGGFCVSRVGAANDLTIVGTVNGNANPKILFDGSTASPYNFEVFHT